MDDWQTPTGVANQALDAAGVDFTLGDIQEGTTKAQKILRAYGQCLRQLLRAAHWNCARKEAPLQLLADGTGNTANVGTQVPGSQFIYEYAYPTDCLKVRYVPWNPLINVSVPSSNIVPDNSGSPLTTSLPNALLGQRPMPARFLVTTDQNYIPDGTALAPVDLPGVGPTGRLVIMTNVQNARCIYTFNAFYPTQWDAHFRAALVAYLAAEIAMPLARDKKFGLVMRDRNMKIAESKILEARISDGNESWANADLNVDWMRARLSGGIGSAGMGWGGPGPGIWWGGFDNVMFGNSAAY